MAAAAHSPFPPFPPDSLWQQITQRIRQSLELPEILAAATMELQAALKIDRVSIYRFHPAGPSEVMAESRQSTTLPALLGGQGLPNVPSQTWETWLQAHPSGVMVDALQLAEIQAGVQASLVVSIRPQQALWGVLVGHHAQPHPFSPQDLQIAQFVGDQVAIAIAQATLLAEARRQARQESTINQIVLSLHGLPEIDLQTGLQQAIAALHCDGGRLYRGPNSTQALLLYGAGVQPQIPPSFPHPVLEQHILWQEYFRPAPRDRPPTVYALPDVAAEPRLRTLAPAFQPPAIRGLLVLPLTHRQQFLGYLTLFRVTLPLSRPDTGESSLCPQLTTVATCPATPPTLTPWTEEEIALAVGLTSQFAIAIHEHDLFQQLQRENQYRQQVELTLRRQAEEERLRVAILQRIRQSLNFHTIVDTTVAEVRQFLQTDRVLIYQFEKDWSGKVVAESVSDHELSILGQVIYDPCFAEKEQYKPYQQGRTSQITNIHQLHLIPCYLELLAQFQVVANLVVPILMNRWDETQPLPHQTDAVGPQLWGLLIAHNCTAPREWQEWEVNFLQQLAVQVAIALNQAELYEQVQTLNVDLEQQVQTRTTELRQALAYEALLKRITDQVRDSLDETQILQTAVEALANGLPVVCCDAAVYDLERHLTTVCYEHLKSDLPPAVGLSADMNNRLELYTPLLDGQHFQFCIVPGATSSIRQVNHQYAIFACPMVDDQGVLGDLWLLKPCYESFEEQEIRLIQQVSTQCAIALRQARLYQAAQSQVEVLARLNQLKDDFLNTVSHELRTPVSNIKMATQMLEVLLHKSDISDLETDQFTQYFQILHAECQREISLIDDLLDLTRLDAESEPLSLTTIDLPLWIPHVAEPLLGRMAEQQQQITFDLPPDLPAITTDLSCMKRILSELLNNACKYTPAHHTIAVSCQLNPDHTFQLRIRNTGIEIDATERDRIFDKFYRIPNNDPWKYGGTGLGLALVKKLTAYLSGSIHVETQPNQTTFVVTLPNLGGGS